MENRIVVNLPGERVSLKSLSEALSLTNSLLTELDKVVTSGRSLEWHLSGLSFGSAEVVVIPKLRNAQVADRSSDVLQLFLDGLVTLESSDACPERYSKKALQLAKRVSLASQASNGLSFRIDVESRPSARLDITQQTGVAVDAILARTSRSYGSVEGVVEVIHGVEDYFEIVDTLVNRRIRCNIDRASLQEIARLHFGKRLIVSGEIPEDRFGHPKLVNVDSFRPLAAKENLPGPRDLIGLYAGGANG